MRAIVTVLAVGFALWGMPIAAAETTVKPPEESRDHRGVVFTDNPAIAQARPVPVESWSRLPAPDAVAVHFTTGPPECHGVHATVQETPETVTVELRSGTPPEAVGRMCTMIALLGTLDVPLQSPLGDRQVLSVY